jgi:hypothetical protein
LAHLRTAVAPILWPRATNLHGYADLEPPRSAMRMLRGHADPTVPGPAMRTLREYEDLTLPGPAMRTPHGYEEPALPRIAVRTLGGSVAPGRSSGCWLRVGSGFRSDCGLVVRSQIWLVRCAGSAGLQNGRPARRRPTAAGAQIRNARPCRPCWSRWSGRRSGGCLHGPPERRYPRHRGWGGPGFLRSQRRSPGCRSPRNRRQTDGCPRVDGRSRCRRAPRCRRVSRLCRSRRVSRLCRCHRVSRPCRYHRVSRLYRQCWPRGRATCLAGSIRCSLPAPPARPWHRQTVARVSGPRADPSIRRPVARARSRPPPPPTPTLRAVVSAATPPECQIHRKRIEGRYQHGSDPQREDVRRRPTLPRGPPRSTIGAEGLNFRVRNGTGCFPFAMATETLWRCQVLRLNAGRPHLGNRTVDAKQQTK